ncbi:MAG TPA: HD domain-containing phosphohydrolase [Acidobacteriaceae bacterium]
MSSFTKNDGERIVLSEVVSALSFALDLTDDAVPGHALPSCLLGMRIGNALGLNDVALGDLYYALLLKDVGCSSNAGRMFQIMGGDERKAKREVRTIDWTRPTLTALKYAWSNALPDAGILRKARRAVALSIRHKRNNAEMIDLRCAKGASIVRKIGFSDACAEAIHSLDEHWDGRGYPRRLKGTSTSVLARILCIAQHLDVFAAQQGRARAIRTLHKRSGTWFDPELVQIAATLDREGSLWTGIGTPDERTIALKLEPGIVRVVDSEEVDTLCEGFAEVVDAKSSFTYYHSLGVMKAALGIAWQLGLESADRRIVYRAALLHDLGKLRVPNTILDKPGKLDDSEWKVVREHPLLSQQILERIPSFASIASIAGRHHERLDGSGYPHRLKGDQLSLADRIVAMADVYGALSEDRPYRKGLPPDQIIAIIKEDVPHKLDPKCFEALLAHMALQQYAASADITQAN